MVVDASLAVVQAQAVQAAAEQVQQAAALQRLELLTQAAAAVVGSVVLAHKLAEMVDRELSLSLIQILSQR